MKNRSLFLAFLFLMLFNLGELSAHIMFQRHDIANIPSSNTTIRFHPADLNNDGAMDFVASTSWAPHGYGNDLMEPCEISLTCYPSYGASIQPNGEYAIVHASGFLTGYEDCGSDLTFTANGQSYVYLNCSMVGSQILTITATDEGGNTASYTVPVNVRDLIPPSITCPENQTGFLNDDCQFEIPDYTGLATASDNCSYEITQSHVSGSLVGSGNHTITLTATDPGGTPPPVVLT